MNPIVIFYHCVFSPGNPPVSRASAVDIVAEQMCALQNSGLAEAASEIVVGVNGPLEDEPCAKLLAPARARLILHGPHSFAENLTIVEIEKWIQANPGKEAFIFYHHCKGVSHDPESDYGKFAGRWRRCMQRNLVEGWRDCVSSLNTVEVCCCHWMVGMADGTQNIPAGNFFWARASFLRTVPSIYRRERIKMSGIASLESRYESEVWLGNAPRLPAVKDYHVNGLGACP